ncbi:hypothetical protein N0V93_008663 [Gnomoniopsis smithogilvyi]|uniref:Clr5 domain-containing protein n=1 Tax=Gnomoniopsis smithogilvyi TaxID=1191159 RepID=A0A9W8YPK1_9PEZI|nr:hypothetical protein N0V93_008663 [Gnomoniopsis smithogilvyi]
MSSFHHTPPGAPAAGGQHREGASGLVLTMDTAISPSSAVSQNQYAWPISPDSSNDSRHGSGSSPETDSVETSTKPLKSGRTPSRYDWSKHKPIIKKLYIDEDKTLKEMLEIMQREHNFVATPRMVKTRLKKWGYTKNVSVKSEEVESLMELIFDAESQGSVRRTSTAVTLATGRVVGLDRVAAHLRRKRIPASIVAKASQVSMARYHHGGSPSPTSLNMETPIELRLPESIFFDVQSFVYGSFQRPDAMKLVRSTSSLQHTEFVDLAASARRLFAQNKDTEALALLRMAPARVKDLLRSDDPTIPRYVFMALIHLLNAPRGQTLDNTVKALVRYVAALATDKSSGWPEQHPLRRILFHLGQAGDESLLDIVVLGYKRLLGAYESLSGHTAEENTTSAWLDLGEAAGFASLPVEYLERSLWEAYQEKLANAETRQSSFQQLFWMAELERQKVKAHELSSERLQELLEMTLQACEDVKDGSALNAEVNSHYSLAVIYKDKSDRMLAEKHMRMTIQQCKQLSIDATAARLMAELQGWHREWGEDAKVEAIEGELASQMSNLGVE